MLGALDPYDPLDVPKPMAADLWIVDGPVVAMRWLGASLPFSTRMTIVRLADGRLWVHSPIRLTPELRAAVAALGPVGFLIAPNRLHWLALADWQAGYPDARTCAAPAVEVHARHGGFRIDTELADRPDPAWEAELDQRLVPGAFLTEAVFFHRASRTLILTDLIENFEPEKVHGFRLRLALRLGGVVHPGGGTPRDLMATFLPRRAQARRAATAVLAWRPERIILAHGRLIERDAPAALARALAWTGARPA
jgi:hypothetical protein